MNEHDDTEAEDNASVLFKFYTQKVFSRIKAPEKLKQRSVQIRKNRGD